MLLKNKKGFSEIISFLLILFLVVLVSIVAYKYSLDLIDERVAQMDMQNSINNLKNIKYNIEEIQNFNTATFSININFNYGEYIFENNRILYSSVEKYSGDDYCINDICYTQDGGFKIVYLNLSNSYTFQQDFSLSSGSYYISFKNLKNESKIITKIN
jgi:Na+-transporting NADH:ubiquinone oxidoreductase subunit NqrC